jgi:DNA polymerase III epsilon subunit-like protein
MLLFFDTETTGLPKSWEAKISEVDNWPRIVQLAYSLYKPDGTLVQEFNHIVKPDGFEIPEEATEVHGISTEQALEAGEPIADVIKKFIEAYNVSGALVAHNMQYDYKVLGAEMIRANTYPTKRTERGLLKFCTKDIATPVVKIPGPVWAKKKGQPYKWPKLEELHRFLFKEDFEDAHNAQGDVRATARCFFELVRRGDIDLSILDQ